MIVRRARAEDAAAVTGIVNHLIDSTTVTFTSQRKSDDDLRAEILARGPAFLVVEVDGTVLGYATYFPFRQGPGYAWTKEHSIALAPRGQGIGAGRALMTALEDVAREAGVHSLWAGISAENDAGQAFHAAIGFSESARLPEVGYKFGRWIDLVLMRKTL